MTKIKKFRKNNWSDDEVVDTRKIPKKKKFERAIRTRDIDYLSRYDEEEDYWMPTYSFINTETNEEFEEFMSLSARDEFLKDNPHISVTIRYAPRVGYNDAKKPDDGFRDILRKIKKENPRSNVNTF